MFLFKSSKTKSPIWLRALGPKDLPGLIFINGIDYRYQKTFKHDFFAATGLYSSPTAGKVVLKIGRQASLLGFPLIWIGEFLARHEARMFNLVRKIEGIPRFDGRYGPTGIVHEYVEGHPLTKEDTLDNDFFLRLDHLISEVHARGMAYVDLEKRENILRGDDGRPYLIDFQISWHWPDNRGGRTWPARLILQVLQSSDRYHLLKHWRRLRPDQLTPEQERLADLPPPWIRWHRLIFRPITQLRRRILVRLGARSSPYGRSPG